MFCFVRNYYSLDFKKKILQASSQTLTFDVAAHGVFVVTRRINSNENGLYLCTLDLHLFHYVNGLHHLLQLFRANVRTVSETLN